jgi:hypothetical protein
MTHHSVVIDLADQCYFCGEINLKPDGRWDIKYGSVGNPLHAMTFREPLELNPEIWRLMHEVFPKARAVLVTAEVEEIAKREV